MPLLYHTPTHYPEWSTLGGRTLIWLHVRTRRPRRRRVMPEFPENRFISVATCRAKACLLIWLALLVETEHIILRLSDPTSILFQTPLFARCLELLMMIAPEMDLSFYKRRCKGRLKLIGCDRLAEAVATEKWWHHCDRETLREDVAVAIRADMSFSGYQSTGAFLFHTASLSSKISFYLVLKAPYYVKFNVVMFSSDSMCF